MKFLSPGTGSTQGDQSQHVRKSVDWNVKNQNKQTNLSPLQIALYSHHLCLFPGMMIESMAGKAGAMHGQCYDATPFKFSEDDSAIDHFGNMLLAGNSVKSI